MIYNQFTNKYNVTKRDSREFIDFLESFSSEDVKDIGFTDSNGFDFKYIIEEMKQNINSEDIPVELSIETVEKIKEHIASLTAHYIEVKNEDFSNFVNFSKKELTPFEEKARISLFHSLLSEFHFKLRIGIYPSMIERKK